MTGRRRPSIAASVALCIAVSGCAAQVPTAFDAPDPSAGASNVPTPVVATPTETSQLPSTPAPQATAGPADGGAPATTTTSVTTSSTTTQPPESTTLLETTSTVTLASSGPSPSLEAFGDGTHIVGTDVDPGRYEIIEPGPGCSWERLNGLSGEYQDLLAGGNPQHRVIVDIPADDVAFASADCGTWSEYQPFDESLETFGPGTWAVGEQVVAGTYTAPGGAGCFWALLTSFDGEQTSIRSVARPPAGTVTVTVQPSDIGFVSDYCGVFVLMS